MGGGREGKNLSEELVMNWYVFCYESVGHLLPINYISRDLETGMLGMGFECPDGPPIHCKDGSAVRLLTVRYNLNSEQVLWS
jgi:hypothetical protein